MTVYRNHRPRRTPVFIGCEGESERGYGQMLSAMVREKGLPFHLETVCLNPGSGSPAACIERAKREIQRWERNKSSKFSLKIVMLDTDAIDSNPAEKANVERAANNANILIIWQSPCHEAFLLRHFQGHDRDAPATSTVAFSALLRVWPNYTKAMSSMNLSKQINIENVRLSASVHPDFLKFLKHIRLHN